MSLLNNPIEFDMNILQERLKEQKRMREKAARNKTPQRKDQYTPVEIDTGTDDLRMVDSATTDSESSGEGAFHRHPQCKKQLPPTSAKPRQSPSSSTSESETTPKKKPLPPPPSKKPGAKRTPIPVTKEDVSTKSPTQTQSIIDRMNQPLPPTPTEESLPSSRGQNVTSNPSFSTSASGRYTSSGNEGRHSKKKQLVPIPAQRVSAKRHDASKTLTAHQLHEPASYANLPAQDTPYQNMTFGSDASAAPEEPVEADALYENVQKVKSSRLTSSGAQPRIMNGSGVSNSGSEYQNTNASRRPRV